MGILTSDSALRTLTGPALVAFASCHSPLWVCRRGDTVSAVGSARTTYPAVLFTPKVIARIANAFTSNLSRKRQTPAQFTNEGQQSNTVNNVN
jgi:hypothetical protein